MIEIPEGVRSRGYATGNATKQLIVARAAEAFAQTGFHGTSLRGIAREAGVDHSTLLHHFGNKAALLLAVLEWHDTQSIPADLPDEITPEVIVAGFAAVAGRNEQKPGLVALLSTLSAEAGASDHPAREPLRKRHAIIVGVIASAIRAQRDAGAVPDDELTPEQSAAVIISTWEGMQVYSALHPGELDVPAIVEQTLRRALGLP